MTLAVGERAPDFTLPATTGEDVTLSALVRRRTVVLFFYPKDDTPGCTAEACAFRDRYEAFVGAGAEVVGISADSAVSHDRFATKHKLPMTLLSDPDGRVRALYGVRPTLGVFPGRATFVIDSKGIVRHVFVSQLRTGAHVEKALAVVKEIDGEAKGGGRLTSPSG